MPASTVSVIASLTSGLGIAPSASATTRKPGRAAINAPKPYSEAVFIDASNATQIAFFVPSAKLARTGFHANTITVRMTTSTATSTAQIAAIVATSCTHGPALPTQAGTKDLP